MKQFKNDNTLAIAFVIIVIFTLWASYYVIDGLDRREPVKQLAGRANSMRPLQALQPCQHRQVLCLHQCWL